MAADDDQRVRQLAYRIWESEGRPEGQQQRHWDRALKIVAAERVSGNNAWLEEVDEPHDETPILEDDLPLEADEVGIEENRLPLDEPEIETPEEEVPYRDDAVDPDDVPVQDRGTPDQTPLASEAAAQTMDPLPEDSDMVSRAGQPRSTADTVTTPDPTDTSQVPGKSAVAPKKPSTKRASSKASTSKTSQTKAAAKPDKASAKTTLRAATPRKPKK